MKNYDQNAILVKTDLGKNKFSIGKKSKTTNVNILLNQVRLDQKRDFRKKIIFISILLSTLGATAFFVII